MIHSIMKRATEVDTNSYGHIQSLHIISPADPFTDPVGKALLGPYSANETTTGALDPTGIY